MKTKFIFEIMKFGLVHYLKMQIVASTQHANKREKEKETKRNEHTLCAKLMDFRRLIFSVKNVQMLRQFLSTFRLQNISLNLTFSHIFAIPKTAKIFLL